MKKSDLELALKLYPEGYENLEITSSGNGVSYGVPLTPEVKNVVSYISINVYPLSDGTITQTVTAESADDVGHDSIQVRLQGPVEGKIEIKVLRKMIDVAQEKLDELEDAESNFDEAWGDFESQLDSMGLPTASLYRHQDDVWRAVRGNLPDEDDFDSFIRECKDLIETLEKGDDDEV